MRRADGGDYGALGELIARAMYDNLNRFIVSNVAGPARMVPLTALADEEFTLIALRRAAQRGRLDAVQGPDGIWRSSRKAVDAYRARHQRHRGEEWSNISLTQLINKYSVSPSMASVPEAE